MAVYTAIQGTPPISTSIITADTQMVNNIRYLVNGGSSLNLTLPATASVGDLIQIDGESTFGYVVLQNASQSVTGLGGTTTVGAGGSITSFSKGDCIRLICTVDNLTWIYEVINGPNLLFV